MAQSLGAHYGMLLGLNHSWEVADVKLELEAKRVTIQLGFTGKRVTCPCCEASCTKADHAPERTWRHLDTKQFETMFVARLPRADCKVCGVKTPEVQWAGKHSPFNWIFEAFALMILEAALDRGLSDRDLSTVEKVGMDEKSFLRGQCYVTTLCDLEKVRVIEVVEGRKEEDARAWAIGAAQGVLKCPGEGFAESHFERWYAWAIRSRLKPVARMLRRHLQGLLAYFRHWITNAAVEGLDSKIQAIKWLAAINGKCRITPGPVQTWTAV